MIHENITDFAAALSPMAALAGLDLGTKTIGVALSDRMLTVATPTETIKRKKFTADAERLVALLKDREIGGIVLGLPRNMDGSEGPMAAMIRAVVARLESRLPAIEFSVRDERLTSWSAEQEEFAKGRKPWKDKGKIDTRAAMLLLEDYLAAEDPSRALLPEDAPPPPSLLKPGRQKPGRDRSRGRGRGSRKGGRGRR